jgi:hypothetical protein
MGAGLLLRAAVGIVFNFIGLESKTGDGLTGVFPASAYLQNGAGELVVMC